MNNKIIVGLLGVVVVLGGVYYTTRGTSDVKSDTNSIAVGEPNPATPNEDASGKKMSFESFMRNGGSYVCTVNQLVEGISSKGTVYINDNNIRGEFKTSVAGMNIDTYFITKEGYSYTWSSAMAGKGFKAPVVVDGTGDTTTKTSGQYSFDANQIGDYDCQPWTVDSSKFNLPSNVTFTLLAQ